MLIKLADRLHNLKTLEPLPRNKRKKIAVESLEVYAPIAERLSLGQLRGEIEDLSFQYSHPQEYQWVKKTAEDRTKKKLKILRNIQKKVEHLLQKSQIKVIDIHLRSKHYYSLYQKLLKHNTDIDRIYDLNVIRIVVESERECYAALGKIHEMWRPLKGHIKDYIAQPKANGYRSLHTTTLTRPEVVEFQIKTAKMHQQAENGIAYLYAKRQTRQIARQPIFTEIKILQREFRRHKEKYLDILKADVFQKHIVVFTPHGDVITLPQGATPVDFAYKIHTDIGNKFQQAKVNDKTVAAGFGLKSGDIVEIITNPRKNKPETKWLKSAKTQYARYQIYRQLKK